MTKEDIKRELILTCIDLQISRLNERISCELLNLYIINSLKNLYKRNNSEYFIFDTSPMRYDEILKFVDLQFLNNDYEKIKEEGNYYFVRKKVK